ncbi:MAG TPA: hypothetical protein VGI81_26280 [Tepidisphaeraceae bacterium]|jgi:hypothetical protein
MDLSIADYAKAAAMYERRWKLLDETLYQLCREHPGHSEAEVHAKAWVIGRTYATGIERAIRSTRQQGSSLSKLAQCLQQNANALNRIFGQLEGIREPLDPQRLSEIVRLHGEIIRVLKPVTRAKISPRSFVSKYMHFHNPAVPIFDSFADQKLKKLVRWSTRIELFELPHGSDLYYGWYVMRFFEVYKALCSSAVPVNAKLVDTFILY